MSAGTITAYFVFALLSMFLNITSQALVMQFYIGRYALYFSIIFGTIIGLISKFLFDRFFIFKTKIYKLKSHINTFALYSITGIITTTLFWIIEYSFELIFSDNLMRYFGASIGLSIGYFVKYHLDKRYVF